MEGPSAPRLSTARGPLLLASVCYRHAVCSSMCAASIVLSSYVRVPYLHREGLSLSCLCVLS